MSLVLGPVTEDDLPEVCRVQRAAFGPNPLHLLMFPPGVDIGPLILERHRYRFHHDTNALLMKAYDPITGDMAAYAKWVDNSTVGEARGTAGVENKHEWRWPEGANRALIEEFYGTLDRKSEQLMGNTPHFFLSSLVTHPDHQRRGAGAQLLDWGIAKADAAGIPAYLEASPSGAGLYRSRGFEDLDSMDIDLQRHGGTGHYCEIFMLRPVPDASKDGL